MVRSLLVLVLSSAGCAPRIARGPALQERIGTVPVVEVRTGAGFAVGVRYPAGARYDPPGRAGLGWLAAEVRWRGGTGGWPASRIRWAPFAEDVQVDLDVGSEWVDVAWRCPDALADTCLGAFIEALTATSFGPEALASAETRRRRLADREQNDNEARGERLARLALYGAHPYGRSVVGDADPIGTRGLPDLVQHGSRTLVRRDLQPWIQGADEEQTRRLSAALADVEPRPPVDAPLPAELPSDASVFVVPGARGTTVVWLARTELDAVQQGGLFDGLLEAAGEEAALTTPDPSALGVVVRVAPSRVVELVASLDRVARDADAPPSLRRVVVVTDAVDRLGSETWVEGMDGSGVQPAPAGADDASWMIGPDDVQVLEE